MFIMQYVSALSLRLIDFISAVFLIPFLKSKDHSGIFPLSGFRYSDIGEETGILASYFSNVW